jgi:hypothetical protein
MGCDKRSVRSTRSSGGRPADRSCGRAMRLQAETLTHREPGHAWLPAAPVFYFYECENRACEHVERVA